MKANETKNVKKNDKYVLDITFNKNLKAKNYTSSKLPMINEMLAKADINTFLALYDNK